MRKHRRSSSAPLVIFVGIVLLCITAVGVFVYVQGENAYKADLTLYEGRERNNLIEIEIPEKSGVRAIANLLKEKDLIPEADSFVRYTKESDTSGKLQAGKFFIRSNLSIAGVVDVLTGKTISEEVRLTIPEGYTIKEVASLLVSKNLITTEEEFLDCISSTCDFSNVSFLPAKKSPNLAFPYSYMEGYLFPDTYFIQTDSFTSEQFIRMMLRAFQTKALPVIDGNAEKIHETIILASILEKESRPRDNQELVAGVIWNRIDNDIQLATDATNRYIMSNPLAPITAQSLASSNPYNLRRQKGLPPSAISNPGLASIKAIQNPEATDNFYYLHDNTGQIHFSRTEAEHNRKKNTYLN